MEDKSKLGIVWGVKFEKKQVYLAVMSKEHGEIQICIVAV